MSADDDTELRDLVLQTLEKNGALAKIKAQLRASVFLALEEQENAKKKAPLQNEKAVQFAATEDGRLCAELVADFLHALDLDRTLAVFEAEFQLTQRRPREALSTALGFPSSIAKESKPLMISLLEAGPRDRPGAAPPNKNLNSPPKPLPPSIEKPRLTTGGEGIKTGASFFTDDKRTPRGETTSEDEDFFDSAGRANAKSTLNDKFGVPSTIATREKNISLSTGGHVEKNGKTEQQEPTTKTDEAKSGSSSLSFLGDLPTLGKNRAALPTLTKEKSTKDNTDFLKLFGGDSLDDTDRESTPRDSARLVPGLDLKKLQEPKANAKDQKSAAPASKLDQGKLEQPAKVQRKETNSSADEDISEEIAEDLEVDDLLDSARSSRQLSF